MSLVGVPACAPRVFGVFDGEGCGVVAPATARVFGGASAVGKVGFVVDWCVSVPVLCYESSPV